jgi:Spy/CpxP family protein refolding chaperone
MRRDQEDYTGHAQRLAGRLELSDEQKAKIRPILAQAQTDFQQLRRQHVRDVAQMMDRVHGEVAALLTPSQKVKLDELRQEFRARADRMRREFRGGNPPPDGDGPPPDQPPEPADAK